MSFVSRCLTIAGLFLLAVDSTSASPVEKRDYTAVVCNPTFRLHNGMFPVPRTAWRNKYNNLQQVCVQDGSLSRVNMDCYCSQGSDSPTCGNSASWQYVTDSLGNMGDTARIAYDHMESTFIPICERECACLRPTSSVSAPGSTAIPAAATAASGSAGVEEPALPIDANQASSSRGDQASSSREGASTSLETGMCGTTCDGPASSHCSGAAKGGCQCVVPSQFIMKALNLDPVLTRGLCLVASVMPALITQLKADAMAKGYSPTGYRLNGRNVQEDESQESWEDYKCFCNATHQARDCCDDGMATLPI